MRSQGNESRNWPGRCWVFLAMLGLATHASVVAADDAAAAAPAVVATGDGPLETTIEVQKLLIRDGSEDGAVREFVDAQRLNAGEQLYYTIRVTNPGQKPVDDVTVTKRLPYGVDYVPGSAVGPGCRTELSLDGGVTFERTARARSPTCAGSSSTHSRPAPRRCCDSARSSSDMASEIDELFGSDGPLARALPGYKMRDGQLAMAAHVSAAMAGHDTLVVEAGTGTGKTFAYLVPALVSGRRVIISTGTRALQDQLYHRDLPAVCGALGRPVRVALLKGRANYLCRHRLDLAEQQAYSRGLRREVATAIPKVRAWSHTTRRGDIAELSRFGEQDLIWPWVTSTRENCVGTECPRYEECFVLSARREAQAADIVVVNHYLLMADLVLKEEGFGDLLPGADAIVIDEAHQLPDVAAQLAGYSVSTRQLAAIAKDVAGELLLAQQMGTSVDAALTGFDAQVGAVVSAAGGMDARLEHSQWPERMVEALGGLASRAAELGEALVPLATDGQGAIARLRERLSESAERLESFTREEAEGGVRWAETNARSVSCHYAPVDVATQLSALMQAQAGAWILTSATLAVGDDFSHFKRRSGLSHAECIRFESPFDFAGQALLYLPKGLDDPGSPGHTRGVIAAALPVLDASGGRAFLLFTSHRALREGAWSCAAHGATRRRCRCSCRARVRATSCCGCSARPAMRSCWAPAVSGRVWTSRARRCRSLSSTSCHSQRPTIRCSRRGSRRSARGVATRSSRNRSRRP